MPLSLDSKTKHYISTIAHRASLSRQHEKSENATSSQPSPSQITTPTGSILNAYNGYLCFRARSDGPLYISIILMIASSVALAILLLIKLSKWSRIYYNSTFKGYFSS